MSEVVITFISLIRTLASYFIVTRPENKAAIAV